MDIKIKANSVNSPSFRQLVVRKNAAKAFRTFIKNNNEGNEIAVDLIEFTIDVMKKRQENNPFDMVIGLYGKARQLGVSIQKAGKRIVNPPVIFEKGLTPMLLEKHGSLHPATKLPEFLHTLIKTENVAGSMWRLHTKGHVDPVNGTKTLGYTFK